MNYLASKDGLPVPLRFIVSLICRDHEKASGGCNRSRQLLEILRGGGWRLEPIEYPPLPVSRLATLRAGLAAVWKYGPLQPFGVESLRAQGLGALRVEHFHGRYRDLQGVILEGTGYGALASVAAWKACGLRTVLVPANIESLAPNSGSWTHRGLDVTNRFAHERRWWGLADAIFTISVEEAWWLKLHGIEAQHLPYFPAPGHRERLERIRRGRLPNRETGLLWLADFRNPANLSGIRPALRWLAKHTPRGMPVLVVGRGTEFLQRDLFRDLPQPLRILGEKSEDELEQLQCRCLAQMIVHPATSGMLTRVVDAAVAGIPIVGNAMALKSYRHFFAGTQPQPDGPFSPRVLSAPERPDQEAQAFLASLSMPPSLT